MDFHIEIPIDTVKGTLVDMDNLSFSMGSGDMLMIVKDGMEGQAHTCDNSSSFSNGSTFSTNLNLVINDLFRNAPQSSGYNISSHGQNPNKVYGLLQCTGDILSVKCSNCVVEANSSIHERCPNDIGGRIWLDDCFMRYHNTRY
ncbi:cysteine-rich repeat secretory protein 38-like [Cryptomeria japonica]|uniref:cysteine-rich repeat secretory protein 38-like n=1 Tax=Cryptomeria japonica TaxID=3369 RepID=UPI0027DA9679|nr:cysteine-rich repeat secretory protein 38-like [Cryptomeria japonica]